MDIDLGYSLLNHDQSTNEILVITHELNELGWLLLKHPYLPSAQIMTESDDQICADSAHQSQILLVLKVQVLDNFLEWYIWQSQQVKVVTT